MNKRLIRNTTLITLCALFSIFGSARDAFAQARKAGAGAGAGAAGAAGAAAGAAPAGQAAGKKEIAIKKVEMTKVKTPDYSSSINEATTTPGDWTKIMVRFDTEAEWTDQLEMRFYIVVKNPKTAAYTMFTGMYVYSDIPKGRNHQAAVFLRPRTVERYGAAERAAVEMYSKGELVAAGSFPEDNKPWWRTATVRSVEGYVIERSQTPFANIAGDNYELPKGK